jgi:hypothetical protein
VDTTNTDVLTSLRRTLVPIAVGFLLSQAARVGFDIPADQLTGVIEALVTGTYYSVVRILEVKFPGLGVLLGATRQPKYTEA